MQSNERLNARESRTQAEAIAGAPTGGRLWRLLAAGGVFALVISACAVSAGGPAGQGGQGSASVSPGGGAAGGSGGGTGPDDGGAATNSGGGSGNGGGTSGGSSGNGSGASGSGGSGSGGSQGGSSSSGSSGSGDGGNTGSEGTGGNGTMGCGETLPAITDYSMGGPYATTTVESTGPDGGYTVIQPMTLGQNGFKHPVATWGNGITTTPSYYGAGTPTTGLMNLIASNGFVVVASNSSSVTTDDMTGGLDWMIQQNGASGPYQGKLDTNCLVAIGYSLGGGAAVGAGAHPDIVTTVSFHGVTGNSAALKTPLLLFTSTTDTFVTPSGFVAPTYNASVVQTFYATLTDAGDPSDLGHLLPVSILDPTDPEYAPAMAWLRLWVYGDQGGRDYFWGSGALLCQSPDWTCQSKEPGGASQMTGF